MQDPQDPKDKLSFLNNKNRYTYLDDLGKGTMGKVKSVFDTILQRVVANKELNKNRLHNPLALQTFVNEIKLMGRLSHPGILPIYDAAVDDEMLPSYSMRLAEGDTLAELLQIEKGQVDGQALPLETAVKILVKLSETLTYAHDRGILHLDLKPENIMVGAYGEVFIMDWGAARVYDVEKYTQSLQTFSEQIEQDNPQQENEDLFIGTPQYMSPEQTIQRRDTLTPASDIFSLGVLFYQMLAGIHPFKGKSFEDLTDRIRTFYPPAVNELDSDLPLNIAHICSKMMQKDIEQRYQNFSQVIAAVDDYHGSAAGFPVKHFTSGEVIFKEGEPSDYVCVVVSGRVAISIATENGSKIIAELGKNEPFGEHAAITGNPRAATAFALDNSTIRMISKQDIADEIDKLSPWVGSIVNALSNRFIEQNARVIALEKQIKKQQ